MPRGQWITYTYSLTFVQLFKCFHFVLTIYQGLLGLLWNKLSRNHVKRLLSVVLITFKVYNSVSGFVCFFNVNSTSYGLYNAGIRFISKSFNKSIMIFSMWHCELLLHYFINNHLSVLYDIKYSSLIKNNFHTVVWYQVFLSNTNNWYTLILF